jgi:flagellar biosynthesis GTPase FlhF
MVDTISGIFIFISAGLAIWGIISILIRKGRRLWGLGYLVLAILLLIGNGAIMAPRQLQLAKEAGFETYSEYSAAQRAGITDPEEWKMELQRQQAAEAEVERLAAEAAAKADAERLAQEEKARRAEEERLAAEAAAKEEEERQRQAEKEEERRKGFHCLSLWDGSHREFTRDVKQRMREPDSFEHIETRVTPVDNSGSHRIRMEYRARNGFGGMNVGVATGTYRNDDCTHTIQSLE